MNVLLAPYRTALIRVRRDVFAFKRKFNKEKNRMPCAVPVRDSYYVYTIQSFYRLVHLRLPSYFWVFILWLWKNKNKCDGEWMITFSRHFHFVWKLCIKKMAINWYTFNVYAVYANGKSIGYLQFYNAVLVEFPLAFYRFSIKNGVCGCFWPLTFL